MRDSMESAVNKKLRAWWAQRQGLNRKVRGEAAASVLARTGWARSVGGCGPYLTLFSRAGISREEADQALAKAEIHELPSARGCTYIVPAADYALALQLAQNFGTADLRTAEKLGVTAKEIDKLRQAVLAALERGPLEPEQIREATGKAARGLGPEGQKKGMSSTLPLALGLLQREGEIRRIPTNGRLDQQRYQYALWKPNPLAKSELDPERANTELARRFFDWIGPAALSDFQTLAGISAKAGKLAVDSLKLEPVMKDSDCLMPAEQRAALEVFQVPKEPAYHLITALDSLLLLHRDLRPLLDAEDAEHPLLAGKLTELPSPAIVDRGRIVGLWEYDPRSESIAYVAFVKENALLKEAVGRTEEYVRKQLGDARTFSLDSPKSRQPRIDALRPR